MANLYSNNGFSFPSPSVSSPIYPQFNGTNMATTMHQHLVQFSPPTVRGNTALQAGLAEPVCSGAKWQQVRPTNTATLWSTCNSSPTPTITWDHNVPTCMPWMAPSANNTMYTFNGLPSTQQEHNINMLQPRKEACRPPPACQRRCKRKSGPFPEVDQPREKVFVNEERMVARLEQLQIDNNNIDWHPNLENETWYTQHRPRPKTVQEIDERLSVVEEEPEGESSTSESDSESLPRLEMSELLKIGIKTKQIIPQLILDEM